MQIVPSDRLLYGFYLYRLIYTDDFTG